MGEATYAVYVGLVAGVAYRVHFVKEVHGQLLRILCRSKVSEHEAKDFMEHIPCPQSCDPVMEVADEAWLKLSTSSASVGQVVQNQYVRQQAIWRINDIFRIRNVDSQNLMYEQEDEEGLSVFDSLRDPDDDGTLGEARAILSEYWELILATRRHEVGPTHFTGREAEVFDAWLELHTGESDADLAISFVAWIKEDSGEDAIIAARLKITVGAVRVYKNVIKNKVATYMRQPLQRLPDPVVLQGGQR
jgi:hypothetical protein